MSSFDRSEVEAAFRHYYTVGQLEEDWVGWAHLFTDDAVYSDHFYGSFTGPDEIAKFIEGTMGAAPYVYNPLVWYVIDGGRVVYKVRNRADNPEPGAAPIDFESLQIIEYAGDGKWKSEEDLWVMGEMKAFARRYAEASAQWPQTLEQQLSRADWGRWVDWARPAAGHKANPSWNQNPDFEPYRSVDDIDVGVRSH